MDNRLGLMLIGLGIALVVGFVVLVQYLVKHHPDSRIGQIAKKIDQFIDLLPED